MNNLADRGIEIDTALNQADVELSASEVHGTVIGSIANHLKSGISPDLLKLIEPQADVDDERFLQLKELLYELYRENSELLFEGKEGFDLLLPNEDDDLSDRADGLAAWAKGFILGLLYNNAFSVDQLPESAPEIVRDMMQISEAAAGSDEEQEEDWALAELHEYLKGGAQLVFEFIYSERAAAMPRAAMTDTEQ